MPGHSVDMEVLSSLVTQLTRAQQKAQLHGNDAVISNADEVLDIDGKISRKNNCFQDEKQRKGKAGTTDFLGR